MLILFTIVTVLLALLVIQMNLESWPGRIVWLLVVAATLYFLPGNTKPMGPFCIVVLLSTYQSWKNRGQEED